MADQPLAVPPWTIAALYCFTALPDRDEWADRLRAFGAERGLCGTLIVAREGINGTVAGSSAVIAAFAALLESDGRFGALEIKFSKAAARPFRRFKVRAKAEIVTMGVPDIDASRDAGEYVDAADWNALIERDDVTLIDTRNDFEVAMGTFEGALDPQTNDFRDFPAWADENLPEDRGAPIAMFCTGGIRCEKATAYLASKGYERLYHLRGGILRYLEEVEAEATKWDGACFVFDERVGVGHGLRETEHTLCRSCRMPLDAADRAHGDYDDQVACPHCADALRPADRARRMERRKQAGLARARGEPVIAPDLDAQRARKRAARAAARDRSLAGMASKGDG